MAIEVKRSDRRRIEETMAGQPLVLSCDELNHVSGGNTAEFPAAPSAASATAAPLQPPPPPTWPTW